MKLKDYIEKLAPEMQEKIRACKNPEALLAFIESEGISIPDDALSEIAGGRNRDGGVPSNYANCPICGSTNLTTEIMDGGLRVICCTCGFSWWE